MMYVGHCSENPSEERQATVTDTHRGEEREMQNNFCWELYYFWWNGLLHYHCSSGSHLLYVSVCSGATIKPWRNVFGGPQSNQITVFILLFSCLVMQTERSVNGDRCLLCDIDAHKSDQRQTKMDSVKVKAVLCCCGQAEQSLSNHA